MIVMMRMSARMILAQKPKQGDDADTVLLLLLLLLFSTPKLAFIEPREFALAFIILLQRKVLKSCKPAVSLSPSCPVLFCLAVCRDRKSA